MRTLQCHAGPILVRIGVGVALTLSVALTQVLTLSLTLALVPVPGEQVWGTREGESIIHNLKIHAGRQRGWQMRQPAAQSNLRSSA